MPDVADRKFLTVREFADAVGISPITVYAWLNKGLVREKVLDKAPKEGCRTYRKRRIPASELRRVLRMTALGLPIG